MVILKLTGSNWTDIFLSFIAVVIIAGLTVLLFFSVKKEKKNYKNEVAELMEGVLKKSEIMTSINSYIKSSPSTLIFSLILLDYDKFMELQNAFGANNSKKILEESIKNIRKILPNRVQIGRIGEDRFLVLVKEDYDKNETLRLANKIKDAANKGIKVYADTIINPTISVGIAFYPTHGKTYKQLISSLDLAVFNAKNNGGNQVSLYSDEFDKEDIDNLQFYYEVKEAIKQQQFVLYYQPIINLNDNSIYGLEALLRWDHPTLGILPPSSFINMLEQSGDINAVGVWGIETLIKEYIELRKIFVHKDLQLSINLSPKQLLSDTLGVTFQRIARKYKIPVDHITIEIVEFAMFEKHEIVYKNINNLKEIGFKIAVDGFGIDQNTLAKLGEAPIDIIKLDRTFLSEDDSYIQSKYIELLIDFAKKTNKLVICEGVEDLASVNKIKNYGVEYVQGYYFSKPISKDAIRNYIAGEDKIVDLINPPVVEEVEENTETLVEGEVLEEGETLNNLEVNDQEVKEELVEETKKGKKKGKKKKDEVEEDVTKVIVNDETLETKPLENEGSEIVEPEKPEEEKTLEANETKEESKEEKPLDVEEKHEEKTEETKPLETVEVKEESKDEQPLEETTTETKPLEKDQEEVIEDKPLEEVSEDKPLEEVKEETVETENETPKEEKLEAEPEKKEENKEEKSVKKPTTSKSGTATKKATTTKKTTTQAKKTTTTKKPAAAAKKQATTAKKPASTTKKPATTTKKAPATAKKTTKIAEAKEE